MRNWRMAFLAGIVLSSPALASETVTYTYDPLGRVTQVAHSGSVNSGVQQSYTHDAADNRTGVSVTGSSYTGNKVIVVPLMGLSLIVIPPNS